MSQNKQPAQPEKRTLFKTALAAGAIGVAGYFAGKIMRGGGFGLLVNLLLGIIGGVLGGWVFALLGLDRKSVV